MKKKRSQKKYISKKVSVADDLKKNIARGFTPNLLALIVFLISAQILFFIFGRNIFVYYATKEGLMLLNFTFAILIPYNLAMIVKAIFLIRKEYENQY